MSVLSHSSAELSVPEVILPEDTQNDFELLTSEVAFSAIVAANTTLREGQTALQKQNDTIVTTCLDLIGQKSDLIDRVQHLEDNYAITEEELAEALKWNCVLNDILESKTYLLETDSLTGLLSKSGLEDAIRRLDPTKPTIIFEADMGHFKLFNDRKGHAFGDKVLKEVGVGFATKCRSKDIIARLGGTSQEGRVLEPDRIGRKQGDEFIYLCQPDTDSGLEVDEIARGIIERMRSIGQDIVDTLPGAADISHFHIDIGYAQYDFTIPYSANLEKVDGLMYKDKIAQCDSLGCPMELRHRRGEGLNETPKTDRAS